MPRIRIIDTNRQACKSRTKNVAKDAKNGSSLVILLNLKPVSSIWRLEGNGNRLLYEVEFTSKF